ncbi:MAG: PAS domain S-box protein [Planctomycetaceae bacterium]
MLRDTLASASCDPLALLLECGIGDAALQPQFSDLLHIVTSLTNCPIAILSTIEKDRLRVEATTGIVDPDHSVSWPPIRPADSPVIVADADKCAASRNHPLICGGPAIRSWIAVSIRTSGGQCFGYLSIADRSLHQFTPQQIQGLTQVASQIAALLELHRLNRQLAIQLIEANRTRDMLGAVIDSIDDTLTVKDREGRFLLYNKAAASRSGIQPVEVLGRDASGLLSEEQFRLSQESDRRVMETGQPETIETCDATKSESRSYLTTKARYIRRDGLVGGVITTSRDITDRVRALDSVRHSEERFRKLVENAWDASVVVDRVGRIMYATQSIRRILGLQPADLIGRQGFDFIHVDDRIRTRKELKILAACPDQPRCIQHRIVLPDGVRWLEMVLTNLLTDPDIQGVVINVRDVTTKHRIVQELQQRDALLQKLSLQVPGVIYQFRQYPDGRSCFPYASEGIRQIYEVTPEQVRESAEPVFSIIHPDDFDMVVESIQRSVRNMKPWQCVYRVNLPIQGVQWREGHSKPELLEDGSILWHGYIYDITARRQAEASLQESQARLQAIFDSEPECVKLISPDCRLIDINPAGLRLIDASSIHQVLNQDVSQLVAPEYRDAFRKSLEEVFAGRTTTTEFEIVGLAGTRRWMEQYAVGLKDPVDPTRIVQMLAVARDITDRRRTEIELARARLKAESANNAKSEFLANMSHEIRTPLTAILGYTNLLTDESSDPLSPERKSEAIETIRQAGEHLLTVVNDILDLSKIEAGQMLVEQIETSFPDLVRSVDSLMRPRAVAKGLWLKVICETPIPCRIVTDPTRLRQILMNLLGNSIKFTEQGGITLRFNATAECEKTRLAVSFEDTGIGMSPGQAERLFAAFAQGDSTVTRKYGGTGLGLVICQRLARLLGGDVQLVRTQSGLGSIFTASVIVEHVAGSGVIEDLNSLSAPVNRELTVQQIRLQGRVLLAEDSRDNQVLISFLLRRAGAEVDIAENGLVALEMIEKASLNGIRYELLLTDMQMPEMDGYSLAQHLRTSGSTLPIIALTAHAMAEDRKKCTDAGCDDYASKPIDKSILLSLCDKWIGRIGGSSFHSATTESIESQ